MLNPEDFKLALQNIDALGATPAVLLKVVELTKDPNLDMETLGALLRNDGPLVADIIRLSNSAYYAPAEIHSNLTSAISHLGLREVVRLINLSLARQLFARDLNSYGITAYDYWRDSVASGLILEALAKTAGLNPEDAYTVGILHPIGRLLMAARPSNNGNMMLWGSISPRPGPCYWSIGISRRPPVTSSDGNSIPAGRRNPCRCSAPFNSPGVS
jgi:HD-like signal output (HDOD) protein